MVDALVLAGGNAKDLSPVPAKGLVPVNGRPMVEYVIDALRKCKDIDRICVVLPVEHSFNCAGDRVEVLVKSGGLPEVIKAGSDCLGVKNQILLVSGDVPLITPEIVSDFLDRCRVRKAEIYYPIIKFGESEKRFPDVKRTYARLKEGRFTGGNIVLIDNDAISRIMDILQRVYEVRKEPFKIAGILGISFLLKLVFGLLGISQIEKRVGQLTGSICAGIITPFVEIGIDVDKESDLQLVKLALAGDSNG